MVDVLTNNSSPLEAKKSVLAPASTTVTPQYSPEFLNADAYVAYQEGGKTADDGLGNPTAFGINQNAHKNVDVMNLTPREAQAIRYTYWQAINGDGWAKLDPRTALIGYDTAIMSNPNLAYKLLEKSKGDPAAMYSLRSQTINELAQNPKYADVANNWRSRTQDLGQTVGVVPGTPRTPPVQKLIGPEGVYVPTGYSVDTNTPPPAGNGGGVRTAQNTSPLVPPKTDAAPPEEPPASPIEEGIAAATKAQQETKKPLDLPTPKPNISLPSEPIGIDQKQAYAKALDKIAQRNAATQPTQPSPVYVTPPTASGQAVPPAPLGATEQPSAPKKQELTQNDEAA
jgi:hypothetical protein